VTFRQLHVSFYGCGFSVSVVAVGTWHHHAPSALLHQVRYVVDVGSLYGSLSSSVPVFIHCCKRKSDLICAVFLVHAL